MSVFANIPILHAVVQAGSFSAASQQLGMTKSAVSKRIKTLEDELGVKLIQRTTRKLSLTEAGELYYGYIAQAQTLIQDGQDVVNSLQGSPKGLLKVSLPMVFGQKHIAPLLAEFSRRYPDIELVITLDDRVVDLLADQIDVAIRIGALPDSTLIAKKLSRCRSVLCASPDYLEQTGVPTELSQLKKHNCLFYSYFRAGIEWSFTGPNGIERIKPQGNIQVNNSEVLKQLLLDGGGVCQMPLFIVEPYLKSGELVTLLDDYVLPEHGIYAVYPEREYMPEKLRVWLEFLGEKMADKDEVW